MGYDKTLPWTEIEQGSEATARTLYSSLREAEEFFDKVSSWGSGQTDAQLANYLWTRDATLDKALFNNLESELEAAISDVRALAVALNGLLGNVTQGQWDALIQFR